MDKIIIAAATVATLAVSGFASMAYVKSPKPVTVDAPRIVVVDHPCGEPYASGCFNASRPNQIEVVPNAPAETLAHEMMHWTLYRDRDDRYGDECYVSYLLTVRGVQDAYNSLGWCENGQATTKGQEKGL